jgi:hypothetical protein
MWGFEGGLTVHLLFKARQRGKEKRMDKITPTDIAWAD